MLVLLGWLRPAAADLPAISPADTSPARVLKVTGERLLDTYIPDNERVASTFNHGLETFTRTATPAAAWLTLVKTNDTVGLKVYSVPGPICGTRAATVRAAVQGLLAAGLPPGHIIIWDKHPAELRAAGYYDLGRDLGVAVMSATETGYDSNTFYLPDSPVIGQLVWGDLEFGQTNRDTGKRSFVSKLVSQRLTKIISLVPLINEDAAGVCGHFYSLALGSVDNTLRFENDPGRLAVALPEIVAQPAVGDHVALYITDAILAQYQGGPGGYLQFSTILNQFWFSHDPVALDVLALHELSHERAQAQVPGWQSNLEIYTNANLLQLGQNQLGEIPVWNIR